MADGQLLLLTDIVPGQINDGIISKARETLNRAIQLVNNTPRWGGRVVYGDTDRLV